MAVVVMVVVMVVVQMLIGRDMALRRGAHSHRNWRRRASQTSQQHAFTARQVLLIFGPSSAGRPGNLREMPKHDHLEALRGGMNIMLNKTARAGVSEEYHQAFFDPFYPVDPPRGDRASR